MPQSQGLLLRETLKAIQLASRGPATPVVVFDLDSTLFDVTPRLQRILHDFAQNPKFQTRFPDSCSILIEAEAHPKDWGFENTLRRAGLDGHHPHFHQALKDFWIKTFFSNEYLEFDVPYQGAVEFVQSVFAIGAQIVYLTGRDIPRQGLGTEKILKKWNFPLDPRTCRMVLKPQAHMPDAEFKEHFFQQFKPHTAIWLFENEPVNINYIQQRHPHVQMVFVDTVHSGLQQVAVDVPLILHYILD